MFEKVWQEFYCGECSGYFNVKLNMGLSHGVEVVCPNCKHEHHRFIKGGEIFEQGRSSNKPVEKILPPKSSYHKEPITKKMIDAENKDRWSARRDGVKIEIHKDEPEVKGFLRSLWSDKFGGGEKA